MMKTTTRVLLAAGSMFFLSSAFATNAHDADNMAAEAKKACVAKKSNESCMYMQNDTKFMGTCQTASDNQLSCVATKQ